MIQPLWTSLWEIPDRRMECLVFFGRWAKVIEVGLGRVGIGMRCGVQGAGSSRDRPGGPGRWPGWPDRTVLWCGRSGAGSQDGGGSTPVSALMP